MKRSSVCGLTALSLCALAGVAQADVVTDWNLLYQESIRQIGGPPGPASRVGAMMHTAIYDAVNSIVKTHQPYHQMVPMPANASKEAAVAVAGHAVLSATYGATNPALQAMYDAKLASDLAAIPNGAQKNNGMSAGLQCANGIVSLRATDNSDDNTPYVSGPNVGDWVPTPPDFSGPATPNWGNVSPWGMTSSSQFRPTSIGQGNYALNDMNAWLQSAEYASNYNEVKSLGSLNSVDRTPDQTEIAFFWANDVDGTYKPPGHLNNITKEVSDQQGLSLEQNARLFALANIAMADAGIAAWDAKYNTDFDFWRPITGIRNGDLDMNAGTDQDAAWEPLNPFTPNFPAWISGHATFGAAHAAAMAAFFGTDNIAFDASSEDPFYAALPGSPGTRHFDSFSEAALENGLSRIYLGVHWRIDFEDAFETGTGLGSYIGANYLQPIPTPGSAILLASAGVLVSANRRRKH